MQSRPDPSAPSAVLASLLAAAASVPLALLIAAAGQGLGAVGGGAGWIGLSVPWDRPVWALVNQPVLNFAALPRASGYWLGSTALPLLVALLIMPMTHRLRSLTGQLAAIQVAWSATVIGAAWQAGLDPQHCHLARWLAFRSLPEELRWVMAVPVGMAVVPVVLRLIAAARVSRQGLRRRVRVGLVIVHLAPAPLAWGALSTWQRGSLPPEATVTALVPLAVALIVAWIGYPSLLTQAVTPVRARGLLGLALVLAAAWATLWFAGRPLPAGRAAAVQWAAEGSFNNIRAWMEPTRAPWLADPPSTPVGPG